MNGDGKQTSHPPAVSSGKEHKFNPNFTEAVINATGPKATPRIRQLTAGLIRHLHDFARENELTVDEWMAGVELVLPPSYPRGDVLHVLTDPQMNSAGRMSTSSRNEGQLLCDILGLESLVDEITYKLASCAVSEPTATAILGPFYRSNAPNLPMDSCIVSPEINQQGDRTWMHGIVTDFQTAQPIEGAVVDVWHTAPNGLYEQQDPAQPEMNLRGRFTTGKDGRYSFYCLRPVPYPIPFDGPAGKVLQALDRHPMRPAHIHFLVRLYPRGRKLLLGYVLTGYNSSQHRVTNPSSHKFSIARASISTTTLCLRLKTHSSWILRRLKGIRKRSLNCRMILKWRVLGMRRGMRVRIRRRRALHEREASSR
jgi:catechol 1,2-dioxygenase